MEDDQIVFKFLTARKRWHGEEVLADNCLICRYPNPVIADISLGSEVQPSINGNSPGVKEIEEMSIEERWAYWEKSFPAVSAVTLAGTYARCVTARIVCSIV